MRTESQARCGEEALPDTISADASSWMTCRSRLVCSMVVSAWAVRRRRRGSACPGVRDLDPTHERSPPRCLTHRVRRWACQLSQRKYMVCSCHAPRSLRSARQVRQAPPCWGRWWFRPGGALRADPGQLDGGWQRTASDRPSPRSCGRTRETCRISCTGRAPRHGVIRVCQCRRQVPRTHGDSRLGASGLRRTGRWACWLPGHVYGYCSRHCGR